MFDKVLTNIVDTVKYEKDEALQHLEMKKKVNIGWYGKQKDF